MTNPNIADQDEAPLDPAFEKVRRKMVRLLVISSSVIILGLMAVVFSIVYRVDKRAPAASPVATAPAAHEDPVPAAQQSITLPEAFVVESSSISGNRILIFGADPDGRQRIFVHDIGTGKRITEIEIK
jgi:hypothetical protein